MVGITKAQRLERLRAQEHPQQPAANVPAPFEARPDVDPFDLHVGIVDHFDLDRHYSAAMIELMEASRLRGADRDAKTVRAIRFLKASLGNPDLLNAVLMLAVVPGAMMTVLFCAGRIS